MGWTFQPIDPMGGATGEAFSNVLTSTGMTTAAVLARESIQNSVDAAIDRGDEKVRVAFRHHVVSGNAKNGLVGALHLHDIAARASALNLPDPNCLESLGSSNVPINTLYIEDYGTHGLYGDPHAPSSHFFRLLLSLGDSSKAREAGSTGGSYGYGKAVYSANSRIHTIVAYSVFDPSTHTDETHARLMGCSYFSGHTFGDQGYTGRAWLGRTRSSNPLVVGPIVDDQAHRVAESLGFVRRDPSMTGTSILIVDCPIDINELRKSTEDWWWPRILEDDLDVEIWSDEKRQDAPRPRSRSDLKPFIHCFEMAINRSEPVGEHDKVAEFNRLKDVPLGGCGFTLLDDQTDDDEENDDEELTNRLALIRSPRMVVQYLDPGRRLLPFAGVFVAAPEVDHTLKISEPPAHDRWDPNSSRLQDDTERDQVRTIVRRLKQQLGRFINSAGPPSPPDDAKLDPLERMLGLLFRSPSAPSDGDGGSGSDPIEITFEEQPRVTSHDDGLRTSGSFRVGLKPEAEREEVTVSVRAYCFPVEDTGVSKDDPIRVYLSDECSEPQGVKLSENDRVVVTLRRSGKARFAFVTDTYRSDWTTSVSVQVEEESSPTHAK